MKSRIITSPEKNVWHCFRCNTGGGAISLIAVLEGIIACHEAIPGGLKGDKFKETLRLAHDRYGFNIKVKTPDKDITPLAEDKVASLEARIKTIPSDTTALKIPGLLDPILKEMALLNPVQSDVLLKHTIKEHFSLTLEDIKSYDTVLKNYRTPPKNDEAYKPIDLHRFRWLYWLFLLFCSNRPELVLSSACANQPDLHFRF